MTEADGTVGFTGIWLWTKVLGKLKFGPDNGVFKINRSLNLQFIQRKTSMCIPNFMVLYQNMISQGISKDIRMNPLGTMNACPKFYADSWISGRDIKKLGVSSYKKN